MKHFGVILLGLLLFCSCGCEQLPPLAPGKSGLQVRVMAQPKNGLHDNGAGGYVDLPPEHAYEPVDYENLPGVIVWLEPTDNTHFSPAPLQETVIPFGQAGVGQRTPQGVAVGSKVDFENHGNSPQSIYSVSDGNDFNLGTIPPGRRVEWVAQSPGLIEVLSDAQPNPVARLYATPSPWLRTVRANEPTNFPGLSPGNYRIACWHERLPGSQQVINLAPDKWSKVTLTVSVNLLPALP